MRKCAALLCLLPVAALAGRPFSTDDAGVTAAGECELESYLLRASARGESVARGGWIQPNCGVGRQTQLSIGAGHTDAGGNAISALVLAGKTALRELSDTQTGFALAYSAAGSRSSGQGFRRDSTAVAAIVSTPLEKDLLLHANLGWLRSQVDRRNSTTWNVALERTGVVEHLDAGAEVYGDSRTPGAFVGIGARYALRPEKLFVDFSWARSSASTRGTLATLGIKLAF